VRGNSPEILQGKREEEKERARPHRAQEGGGRTNSPKEGRPTDRRGIKEKKRGRGKKKERPHLRYLSEKREREGRTGGGKEGDSFSSLIEKKGRKGWEGPRFIPAEEERKGLGKRADSRSHGGEGEREMQNLLLLLEKRKKRGMKKNMSCVPSILEKKHPFLSLSLGKKGREGTGGEKNRRKRGGKKRGGRRKGGRKETPCRKGLPHSARGGRGEEGTPYRLSEGRGRWGEKKKGDTISHHAVLLAGGKKEKCFHSFATRKGKRGGRDWKEAVKRKRRTANKRKRK